MRLTLQVGVLVFYDGKTVQLISLHMSEDDARAKLAARLREDWEAVHLDDPDTDPAALTNAEVIDRWFGVTNIGKRPGAPDRARWIFGWCPLELDLAVMPRTEADRLADEAREVRARFNRAATTDAARALVEAGGMSTHLLRYQRALAPQERHGSQK